MSESLRVALVAEGPTDGIVLGAALQSILEPRTFIMTQLQPEGSVAFGSLGTGWGGVYRWCKQSAARGGGQLSRDDLLFLEYDLLIVHVDADVADKNYSDAVITPEACDPPLPCAQACPPALATCDALRSVLLGWCGESVVPGRLVLCVPSKSTEAWVVAALFPDDLEVVRGSNFECYADPESRLAQQKKRHRIKKNQTQYRARAGELKAQWSRVSSKLGQSGRFTAEIRAALT